MNGAGLLGFVLFVAVFALAVSLSRLTLVKRPVMRLVAAVAAAVLAVAGAVLLIANAPWQADAVAVVSAAIPVLVSLQTAAHLKMRRALRRRTTAAPVSTGGGIRATLPAMSTSEIDASNAGCSWLAVRFSPGTTCASRRFARRHQLASDSLFYAAFPDEPDDEFLGTFVVDELAKGGISLPSR